MLVAALLNVNLCTSVQQCPQSFLRGRRLLCTACGCRLIQSVSQQQLAKPSPPKRLFDRSGFSAVSQTLFLRGMALIKTPQLKCFHILCACVRLGHAPPLQHCSWFASTRQQYRKREKGLNCWCEYVSDMCKGTHEPPHLFCVGVCAHLWPGLFFRERWAHEGGSYWGIGKCMGLRPISNPRLILAFHTAESS